MPSFTAVPTQSGTAFVRVERSGQITRWTIGNDQVTCTLGCLADGILQLESIERPDRLGPVVRAARDVFTLRLPGDATVSAEAAPVVGDRTSSGEGRVDLEIELDAGDLGAVRFCIECVEHQGILRQWLEVTTMTATAIAACEPLIVEVANPEEASLFTVAGVQHQGGWRPEVGVYRSFRLESRGLAESAVIQSGERSTWDETPWAAVVPKDGDEAAPGGLLLAFDYGGQWELTAHPNGERAATDLAFAAVGVEPQLAVGETWRSAATWVGIFPGNLDSASRMWVDYLRALVIPRQPDGFPWIQYNTWYSYACELETGQLLKEADIAAELGVEVFYIDAGWWVGNPQRWDHFASGLGNWRENRAKFPEGIRAFADRIRERGMHFGIWVEPERVDLRTATTGTWRTDWIATRNGDYLGPEWPRDTDTAWLCFGEPATQAWATQWIGDMIQEYGVRWLKWDSNYWGVCTNPDHGHGETDGEAAQLQGVYTVMDVLRERFPDLVIENCAGGGTRMDFSIARHSHAWWMDDASEPGHRTRMHSSGAGYLFPMETLNSWITESAYENLNGQDLPDPVVRAIFRSRMMGALGISCRMVTWSPAVRAIVAEELAMYAATIRPLVREGYLLHLLPQPDLECPRIAAPPIWEAFQLQAADGQASVVLGFRNLSSDDVQRVFLRNLQPETMYELADESRTLGIVAGSDLMETGWELACAPLTSALLQVTATA